MWWNQGETQTGMVSEEVEMPTYMWLNQDETQVHMAVTQGMAAD